MLPLRSLEDSNAQHNSRTHDRNGRQYQSSDARVHEIWPDQRGGTYANATYLDVPYGAGVLAPPNIRAPDYRPPLLMDSPEPRTGDRCYYQGPLDNIDRAVNEFVHGDLVRFQRWFQRWTETKSEILGRIREVGGLRCELVEPCVDFKGRERTFLNLKNREQHWNKVHQDIPRNGARSFDTMGRPVMVKISNKRTSTQQRDHIPLYGGGGYAVGPHAGWRPSSRLQPDPYEDWNDYLPQEG